MSAELKKDVRAKWQPTAADLQNCETLGRKVAAAVTAG
jgi:flavorubredoxin